MNQMSLFRKITLLITDIAILYLSLVIALIIRYGISEFFASSLSVHLGPFSLLFFIWVFVFYLADLYRNHLLRNRAILFSTLGIAILISTILSMVALYLFEGFFQLTPKTNLLIFAAVFFTLDFLARVWMFRWFRVGATGIAVLGDSSLLPALLSYLKENPQIGFRVEIEIKNPETIDIQVLQEKIRQKNIQTIVIPATLGEKSKIPQLIYKILPFEVVIINLWDFYETVFEKVPLEELNEGWFIKNVTTYRPFYDAVKRVIDLFVSGILLICLSPILLLIAILIRISSKGPVIFKQERTGKNERDFYLMKFRTMISNHKGPLWTEKNDSRITPIGKILRFAHLDELPQLWNVFKGNISLTGPRPERNELAKTYSSLPYYEMRHVIKPGLTGWAQIHYHPSASLEEAYEKLRYDMYYIKNRSIFIDILIILKTVRYFFTPSK